MSGRHFKKRTLEEILEIYPDLEPAEFKMNALEEYYEEDSRELENGLMVILAMPEDRVPLEEMVAKEEALYKGLFTNRWCKVTEFRVDYNMERTVVHFRGVYSDGNTSLRIYPPDTKWLVKRNSIPKNKPSLSKPTRDPQSHPCLTEEQYRAIAREEAEKAMRGFTEGFIRKLGGFFSES